MERMLRRLLPEDVALLTQLQVCVRTDNFEITHDGVGIPTEIQDKVFEPFFTTKPLGEGTGLGLSTVYAIVKQSGGYVWIESDPGCGATFHICVPTSAEAATVRSGLPHGNGRLADFMIPAAIEPLAPQRIDDASVRT